MTFTRQGKKLQIAIGSISLIIAALLLTLACAGPATPPPSGPETPGAEEPEFHWRFQCAYSEADIDYQVTTQGIAALIEEVSGGKIEVDTYPVGALVAPEEMFSAIRDGSIEMGMDMTGAVGEIVPTDYCTALPGSAENLEEYYDLIYRTGLLDIFRNDFNENGIHLLAITLGGPDAMRASFLLTGWDGIKGKKGWANPLCVGPLTELGGVCVEVPGYDMYTAMKLGNIEWHGWTLAELETLGWKEVTKSVVLDPILKIASNNVYVSLKAWQALSPELQDKINYAVTHSLLDWGLEYRDYNLKAIAASKEYGVEFVNFSAADKAKYVDLCVKSWDELAAKSPQNAQCVELTKEWLKKVGRY
jgi:TRAP-type C4-dicarboxylate transport system substrate-binding protein